MEDYCAFLVHCRKCVGNRGRLLGKINKASEGTEEWMENGETKMMKIE